MRRGLTLLAVVLLLGTLSVAWFTQGTGIIRDDHERNISIPEVLTVPLQVQAAYNGTDVFFRYRWPAERPGMFHDVLVYQGGEWVRHGKSSPGPQPEGLHEDRVAMMIDDGHVPEFGRYGGYVTIGSGIYSFTGGASSDHDGKYLPATRSDQGDRESVLPDEALAAQREAGYFLDLWHWRSHRSSPIGFSDDQWVGEGRHGDAGKGPYSTNWDKDAGQPKMMFDPAITGFRALSWEDVQNGNYTFDDVYYLTTENAIPYDPNAGWQEGDVIPRRLLREPQGSRGDIRVAGEARWADGYWDVTLTRSMDTGNALDDKALLDQGVYSLAFAIFRNATGARWHYISLPVTLGMGRGDADLTAVRFDGDAPPWDQAWTDVELFYPGQVNWPLLIDEHRHQGAEHIANREPVQARHTPHQLALYGIEVEFMDEIRNQWLLTLFAGVILLAAFCVSMILIRAQKEA